MKKNLFYLSVIPIAVMAVLIIFTMCKKERQCNKCEAQPPDLTKQVSFDLMDKTLEAEFAFYKSSDNGYNTEIVLLPLVGEKVFQFLKPYCISNNIAVDNQSMAFILYLDCLLSESCNVTDEHIKGISLYQVAGRKIMHHLFVKDSNSDFIDIENVKVAVPFVSTSHPLFYLDNYVFDAPQNKSFIIVDGNFAKEVWENENKYRTGLRYEVKKSNAKSLSWDEDYCPRPCTSGRGPCKVQGGIPKGCGDLCASEECAYQLLEARSVERMFINADLMHSFRDNVLYNSEKGENYVDDYYYLSYEYKGKIGFLLALNTALFFRDFNPVMEAFVNPAGHLTEIMFDETLTLSLLDLLDQYEVITESREGKAIIASIKTDVKTFEGQTLQELLTLLQ